MTPYSSMALVDLLDAFASNEPVPGGGSAAALAGAAGASLLMMVAGLPKTLTGSPEEGADLAEASARLRPLRDTLTSLIERDSEAYSVVLEAMRLPVASDADRRRRRDAIDTAMHGAIDAPMETMRCCQQALRGAIIIAQNGYRLAATDTGTGIELLLAGLRSAGMNVDVNARSVTDAAFVERVAAEHAQLAADAESDARRAKEVLSLT